MAKLEARARDDGSAARTRTEEEQEEERRRAEAWERLLATMAPEHVQVYADWRVAADEAYEARREYLRVPRLVLEMWGLLSDRRYGGRPLALPPEVARVYLDDPDAMSLHDCEDCAYPVPVRPARQGVQAGRVVTVEPARRYFERCPLCGGRTGWYAYFHKQQAQSDA